MKQLSATWRMSRIHKPDPKLTPDKQDKRSLMPIEAGDFDQWLEGTADQARALMKLAPLEVFDAGVRCGAAGAATEGDCLGAGATPAQCGVKPNTIEATALRSRFHCAALLLSSRPLHARHRRAVTRSSGCLPRRPQRPPAG